MKSRFAFVAAIAALVCSGLAVPSVAAVPTIDYGLYVPGMGSQFGWWTGVSSDNTTAPVRLPCAAGFGYPVPVYGTGLKVSATAVAPAPSGTSPVSWGFPQTAAGNALVWGVASSSGTFDSLAGVSMDVYGTASGMVRVDAQTDVLSGSVEAWTGSAVLPARPAAAWVTVGTNGLTYHWISQHKDASGVWVAGASEDSTLAQFRTNHPQQLFHGAYMGFGCDGAAYRVQNIRTASQLMVLGILQNHLSPVVGGWMVAGATFHLSAASMYVGGPAAQWLYRPAGATAYTTVSAVVPGSYADDWLCGGPDGDLLCATRPFAADVPLSTNTVVRALYPASDGVTTAASTFGTVHVQTALRMQFPGSLAAHSGIITGRSFVVRGTTYPAKPGATVTFWARYQNATMQVATAKVDSKGAFKFTYTATKAGSWAFWVTVGKDNSNEAAKSVMQGYNVVN